MSRTDERTGSFLHMGSANMMKGQQIYMVFVLNPVPPSLSVTHTHTHTHTRSISLSLTRTLTHSHRVDLSHWVIPSGQQERDSWPLQLTGCKEKTRGPHFMRTLFCLLSSLFFSYPPFLIVITSFHLSSLLLILLFSSRNYFYHRKTNLSVPILWCRCGGLELLVSHIGKRSLHLKQLTCLTRQVKYLLFIRFI